MTTVFPCHSEERSDEESNSFFRDSSATLRMTFKLYNPYISQPLHRKRSHSPMNSGGMVAKLRLVSLQPLRHGKAVPPPLTQGRLWWLRLNLPPIFIGEVKAPQSKSNSYARSETESVLPNTSPASMGGGPPAVEGLRKVNHIKTPSLELRLGILVIILSNQTCSFNTFGKVFLSEQIENKGRCYTKQRTCLNKNSKGILAGCRTCGTVTHKV